MTAAHTRNPKWTKRALIGTVVAVVAAGGIAAGANAAPGDESIRTVRGLTVQEAEEVGRRTCENFGMNYGGPAGQAQLIPGSALGPGRADEFELPVKCIER